MDRAAVDRLEHELGVIESLGFPGYFLIVWDIVRYAESLDILCQIRGSGADSAVCRCLEITRVDPIRSVSPSSGSSPQSAVAPRHRRRLRGGAARR